MIPYMRKAPRLAVLDVRLLRLYGLTRLLEASPLSALFAA